MKSKKLSYKFSNSLLSVSCAMGLAGLLLFLAAGSAGAGSLFDEAINALLTPNHPQKEVSVLGFTMMMIGTVLCAAWIILPPGKPEQS